MKFSEYVVTEGITQLFKNFERWAKSVQDLGATYIVLSSNQHKHIAVDNINKPTMKKYGEWNEKYEEGWTFNLHKPVQRIELNFSSVIPLKEDNNDVTETIPFGKNEEIRKLIKKGAMDPEHKWENALDLVHRAYEIADVERPTPSMRDAWKQYEENLEFAVKMLQKATDKQLRDDSWKTSFYKYVK